MRRVEFEALLYFGVLGIAFFSVIIFAVIRFRKTNSFRKSLLQSIALGILLYVTACWWWLHFVRDGLAQLFGMTYYGIGFIVNCFVNTGVLYFLKKK